jgi:hypothetical protein
MLQGWIVVAIALAYIGLLFLATVCAASPAARRPGS